MKFYLYELDTIIESLPMQITHIFSRAIKDAYFIEGDYKVLVGKEELCFTSFCPAVVKKKLLEEKKQDLHCDEIANDILQAIPPSALGDLIRFNEIEHTFEIKIPYENFILDLLRIGLSEVLFVCPYPNDIELLVKNPELICKMGLRKIRTVLLVTTLWKILAKQEHNFHLSEEYHKMIKESEVPVLGCLYPNNLLVGTKKECVEKTEIWVCSVEGPHLLEAAPGSSVQKYTVGSSSLDATKCDEWICPAYKKFIAKIGKKEDNKLVAELFSKDTDPIADLAKKMIRYGIVRQKSESELQKPDFDAIWPVFLAVEEAHYFITSMNIVVRKQKLNMDASDKWKKLAYCIAKVLTVLDSFVLDLRIDLVCAYIEELASGMLVLQSYPSEEKKENLLLITSAKNVLSKLLTLLTD